MPYIFHGKRKAENKMKIWSYFFFYFIRTVLAVLCLILIIYLIITYLENLLYYTELFSVSPKIKFLYYFWQIPDLVVNILPFAVLIAGVISHWTFARSGEVTALRSAGMSLISISFPFICGAVLLSFANFTIAEVVRPSAFKKYSYIKREVVNKKPPRNIFEKTAWIKSERGTLHFEEYIESKKVLENPEYFLFSENYGSLKQIVRSKQAQFDQTTNSWVLTNASIVNFSNQNSRNLVNVENYVTDVHIAPPKVLKSIITSNEISFFKLRSLIASARQASLPISDRIFDYYLKTSVPFSCLIFLLFSIPFAAQSERKETSYIKILLCLLLTTCYWFGNIAFKKLAISGFLPPFIAAWSLNIAFTIIALFVIAKQEKPS